MRGGLAQAVRALERAQPAPRAERVVRRDDRGVGIVRVGMRDACDRLTLRGVDGLDVASGARRMPLSAVVEIEMRRQHVVRVHAQGAVGRWRIMVLRNPSLAVRAGDARRHGRVVAGLHVHVDDDRLALLEAPHRIDAARPATCRRS